MNTVQSENSPSSLNPILLSWLGLWAVWGYAPGTFVRARSCFEHASAVLQAPASFWSTLPGGERFQERLVRLATQSHVAVADEGAVAQWLAELGASEQDAAVQAGGWVVETRGLTALAETRSAPPFLYGRGAAPLLRRAPEAMVSIVGTRHPDPVGARQAEAIARSCARAGLGVVSGGAIGIDTCAHRGACLEEGVSVAVLAVGLDCPYPRSNRHLFEELVARGGLLVTPFPMGTPARRHHFPRRNALIAALGAVTVVVRAGLRSGSLHTAREARRMGRVVMAVPGDIGRDVSAGSNRLLLEGAVPLLEVERAAAQLVAVLQGERRQLVMPGVPGAAERESCEGSRPAERPADRPATSTLLGLGAFSPAAQTVALALGPMPEHPSRLIERTGLPAAEVAAALLALELGGAVVRVRGGCYVRPGEAAG